MPIIAFFGTKGGVGKTTIVDKFSTLISRAAIGPNVLMVDFDIHHRGLTVLRARDRFGSCRTIHEYLVDDKLEFEGAIDVTPPGNLGVQGQEFLIPSSNLAAEKVFSSLTRLKPDILVERLTNLLNAAAAQYHINIILVDCGPIVDPLTASAAFMADLAFIIGQNEPVTYQALQNYAIRIRDFLPDFNASKVRVILNKVRGTILQKSGVYAAIPFTMEVVDYSEGLTNVDEIRLIYLDYCVYGLIKSIFKTRYEDLTPGPEAVLTPDQRRVIDMIDSYPTSRWYRRLKKEVTLLYFGGGLLILSSVVALVTRVFNVSYQSQWLGGFSIFVPLILGLFTGGPGVFFYWRLYRAKKLIQLKQRVDYEGILELLTTREGRKKFNEIRVMSEKTEKENTR